VFAVQSWIDLYKVPDAIIEVSVEDIEDASERVINEVIRSKDTA
jgi:hypothetical protein